MVKKSIFFPPRHKGLAKIISIRSPDAFRKSIRELKKGGLTTTEKEALVLAQNRARAMLNRRNLSFKEVGQMSEIARIKLPGVTKHQHRKGKRKTKKSMKRSYPNSKARTPRHKGRRR